MNTPSFKTLRPASRAAIAAVLAATAISIHGSESSADTLPDRKAPVPGEHPTTPANSHAVQDQPSGSTSTTTLAGAPTGPAAGDNVDPTLRSAARAVRQVWDSEPTLAKLNLTVTPTKSGLLFEGMVPNAEVWERAKDTAEGVITRIAIDNRIRIRTDFPNARH